MTLTPLFGPIPGGPELIVIVLVLVLLFGANKIPKLARSSGQAMSEFRRGREEGPQIDDDDEQPEVTIDEDDSGETAEEGTEEA